MASMIVASLIVWQMAATDYRVERSYWLSVIDITLESVPHTILCTTSRATISTVAGPRA